MRAELRRSWLMALRGFLGELKRRRVFRVTAVYAVAGWALVQVFSTVAPALHLPPWTVTLVVVLAFLGLPLAVVLAWAYDITPAGIARTLPAEPASTPSTGSRAPGAPQPIGIPMRGLKAGPPVATGRARRGPAEPNGRDADIGAAPDPDRVRRATLAHVRHELRTPINAIIGYTEMLLEDLEPEAAAARTDLAKIHAAGKLLLSRVDAALHPDVLGRLGAEMDWEQFQVRLRHDLRDPINAVVGYGEMLVEQLVDAAAGGAVEDVQRIVAAARQLLGRIEDIVALAAAGPTDSLEAAPLGGTSAMAESVLTKIQPRDATDAEADAVAATLLVVDDDATNRHLLSRQLARQGYSVFTASNGREALDVLRDRDFDLVLLDIMMPEMDGVETLRRIKASEPLQEIPVIMVSALDEIDSVVRCIEFGAADYLTKPFDPVLLRARIGASLEVRHTRQREALLAERIEREQAFSDHLLNSMLPAPVAAQLRAGGYPALESYPEVTALSAELEGWGRAASRSGGPDPAGRLGSLFDEWDRIAAAQALTFTRFAGETCTMVAGVPDPHGDHAGAIAAAALAMLNAARLQARAAGEPLRLRIGIHTGSVLAGPLSSVRLIYDAWGEAVDLARRLRSRCEPGRIQVSPASYARLRDRYSFDSRGVIEVPGGGQMRSYVLQDSVAPAAAGSYTAST